MYSRTDRALIITIGLLAASAVIMVIFLGRVGRRETTTGAYQPAPLLVDQPVDQPMQPATELPAGVEPQGQALPPAHPQAQPEPQSQPSATPSESPGYDLELLGAMRVTDPMTIKLSRQDMQLLRHYELAQTNMQIELCLDDRGVVQSVDVLRSSGVDEVDASIEKQMESWRYLPMLSNGTPAASCQNVNINYSLDE